MAIREESETAATSSLTFSRFSVSVARWTGRPEALALAIGSVVIWAASGPYFGYSENWLLAIGTVTSIFTFLMVFLIQSSQYRDTLALQIKLDELIVATRHADNAIAAIDDEAQEILEAARRNLLVKAGKVSAAPDGVGASQTEPAKENARVERGR